MDNALYKDFNTVDGVAEAYVRIRAPCLARALQ